MESLILAFSLATHTFNLPIGLISALCHVESRHDVHALNPDDGGSKSIGVCQIKLSTARLMGYKGSEKNLLIPNVNVYYAAKYLKRQLDRYHGSIHKAVSAYNAGKYSPLNQGYVDKVFISWAKGN